MPGKTPLIVLSGANVDVYMQQQPDFIRDEIKGKLAK